ncbi:uncharacterized protein LOC132627022 [Lycium barbarum]|uniref:uncharacterized protein LOC132627022 n=1 Tax=Lycium barbarum TaxID=112863 RepID=UPI00293E4A0E|nr:uncharacterized protein LOC132627022 [Lycium barbarum]
MASQKSLLLGTLLLLFLTLGSASNGPILGPMKAQKQENVSPRAVITPGFPVWELPECYCPSHRSQYPCPYGCRPPAGTGCPAHNHHQPKPNTIMDQPKPNDIMGQSKPNTIMDQPNTMMDKPKPNIIMDQPKPNAIMDQPKPNAIMDQPKSNVIVEKHKPNTIMDKPKPNTIMDQPKPMEKEIKQDHQPKPMGKRKRDGH